MAGNEIWIKNPARRDGVATNLRTHSPAIKNNIDMSITSVERVVEGWGFVTPLFFFSKKKNFFLSLTAICSL
jgi:hypothetical protein